ncbi:DUF1254 domain-containing protein [Mycetocola spongiae]|uniref:DUF1254 domain-containing protein n=1 Tax=Mycetocola spongiae TaxID=2859226 RepID=UPI001CF595CF|nr:DUF1254 domain-containing protein [Mycetocola spongiae]UCR88628.1 DUF1254 domain-containing protein [Mycetocola spongiae]
MSAIRVTVENFIRAESNRMFAGLLADTGGVGRWKHYRVPADLSKQVVIRLNRDTLYSVAVVDVSAGAVLSVPDAGDRYLSVALITQDHYIPRVIHAPGTYRLSAEELGTDFVAIAVRILVDPTDPADVEAVNRLQDELSVNAAASRPFILPDYEPASLDATRNALLELSRGLEGFSGAFGAATEVEPIRHLLGAASGWGGLPETEAYYQNVDLGLPEGEYELRIADVPVDAFWSVSLYNAEGFFVPTEHGLNTVNSITAERNADGSATVNFGTGDFSRPNYLSIMPGWNFLVRYYRPRPEVLDHSWALPPVTALQTEGEKR